jgi:hypothetical protein
MTPAVVTPNQTTLDRQNAPGRLQSLPCEWELRVMRLACPAQPDRPVTSHGLGRSVSDYCLSQHGSPRALPA